MTAAARFFGVAALAAGLGTGCTMQTLDDLDGLKNEAWVDVSTQPDRDLPSVAYGLALASAGDTGEGASFLVVGRAPTGFAHVRYGRDGSRQVAGTPLPDVEEGPIDEPLPIAGDPGAGRVALGFRAGSQARVAIIDGVTGGLDRDFPLVTTAAFPAALAFGGASGAQGADLAATAGGEVVFVADYGAGAQPIPERCSFAEGELPALLFADVTGDGVDEILVARAADVVVLSAADVTAEESCPDGITLPSAGVRAMVAGDFDGDGALDLAFGRPDDRAVDVYFGLDLGADPSPEPVRLGGPSGSVRFGQALAAGDFDLDGEDELAVGDPAAAVAGTSAAGVVHILSGAALSAGPRLHDASPKSDQAFGRALGVALFDGAAPLLVSTTGKGEVFTYFRLPLAGSVDPRSGR